MYGHLSMDKASGPAISVLRTYTMSGHTQGRYPLFATAKSYGQPGLVTHTFNPSTEAKTGETAMGLRPAWSTQSSRVAWTNTETLFPKQEKKNKKAVSNINVGAGGVSYGLSCDRRAAFITNKAGYAAGRACRGFAAGRCSRLHGGAQEQLHYYLRGTEQHPQGHLSLLMHRCEPTIVFLFEDSGKCIH